MSVDTSIILVRKSPVEFPACGLTVHGDESPDSYVMVKAMCGRPVIGVKSEV